MEGRVREGVAALLFVEMLFWKSARDTEAVRDQYNWQVRDNGSICLCSGFACALSAALSTDNMT